MSYIYKITNTANGMAYVGNTSRDIKKRWLEHCSDSHKPRCSNRPLYKAINEYGIESFMVEVIEECENHIAPERERYWISKLNTWKNGYNDTMGGRGRPQIDKDIVISTYHKTKSQLKTAKALGISVDSVHDILNKENVKKYPKKYTYIDYLKPVDAYSPAGELVKKFPSVSDAARWLCKQDKATSFASAEANIRFLVNVPFAIVGGYLWKR